MNSCRRKRQCEIYKTDSENIIPGFRVDLSDTSDSSDDDEPEVLPWRQQRDPGLPPSMLLESQVDDRSSDGGSWDVLMDVPTTRRRRSTNSNTNNRRVRTRFQPRPVSHPTNASNNASNQSNNAFNQSNNASSQSNNANANNFVKNNTMKLSSPP